jgi:sugar lactone lactonase YvrE
VSVVELRAEVALGVQASLGEGPVWDERDGTLVFVDIEQGSVYRYDPSSGRAVSFSTGTHVGAVGLRSDGGLVLALLDGFALSGPAGEALEPVPGFATDASAVRFNDGEVDPWGRFVAGTMDWGFVKPVGSLYRLSPDGEVETLLSGVTISNGLAWTPDRTVMYYVDTPTLGVDAFDVDPDDGTMTRRHRVITIDEAEHGRPDGIALDVEGCVWVACYWGSRVCRFTPEGRLDKVVHLPASCVTSVAFAGPRLDQLYITTARTDLDAGRLAGEPHAGDLFVVDPGVAGIAPARFG